MGMGKNKIRQPDNSSAVSTIDGFFGTGRHLGGICQVEQPQNTSSRADPSRVGSKKLCVGEVVFEQTKGYSQINFAANRRIDSRDATSTSKAACLYWLIAERLAMGVVLWAVDFY
jgi:hypothetical protein